MTLQFDMSPVQEEERVDSLIHQMELQTFEIKKILKKIDNFGDNLPSEKKALPLYTVLVRMTTEMRCGLQAQLEHFEMIRTIVSNSEGPLTRFPFERLQNVHADMDRAIKTFESLPFEL